MTAPVFFTIVSRNYLAYALTLMRSVAQHYPQSKRYLCLADDPAGDPALDTELFEVVPIDRLALPDFQAFVFRYDIMELNTAAKPYMFAWLRDKHPDVGIVYLDPDILVLRKLDKVERAFDDGKLLVLTPHLNAPIDDDKFPDELSIMRSGVYNCGFAAINAAHPASAELIQWWAQKLEFGCFVDLESGLFTDQKWMDLAPGMFPDVRILRDDGYNVAYWNLAQRPVAQSPDGGYTAGGSPLVFAHFSGVVPASPGLFSKHQNRFHAGTIGGLRPLYDRYLAALEENGHTQHVRKPYAYGHFADGEKIAPPMRRVYRRLFDVHCAQFVRQPLQMDRDLFNQPCEELPPDETLPVSRLMYEIWCMRADLQQTFNLGTPEGRDGFIRWYLAAQPEIGIPSRYVQPIRETFVAAIEYANQMHELDPAARGANATGFAPTSSSANAAVNPRRVPPSRGLRYRIGQTFVRLLGWGKQQSWLAGWYARVPQGWRMALRRRAYLYSGVPLPPAALPRASRTRPETATTFAPLPSTNHGENRPIHGVNLIGYARGEFGIAENVRAYARALQSSDYPFLIRNFDVGVASRQHDQSMEQHFSEALRYDTNVFFINADQMRVARDTLGSAAFDGRYNIGFWAWELEHFPRAWDNAFELVDEVWVPSEFVGGAIAANTHKLVLKMQQPIDFTVPPGMDRAHFGLDRDAFVFLYSYDFNGYAARKNPEAVIAAFRRAFAGSREKVRLLVKSTNGHRFPDRLATLTQSVADDPRIEVRDGFLSREEMHGLQNRIDCYVSLHRSEGFGLGMAECMYLGKPVIATAYSGNMEFMTPENSCLIDYKLIPVAEGEYPHWQDQQWAEADIEAAASAMLRVVAEPDWAALLGARAAADIRSGLSKSSCAAACIARLDAIVRRSAAA